MELKQAPPEQCSRCGAAFQCGMLAGEDHCWCMDLPHIMPMKDLTRCLCPACLEQEIEGQSGDSRR
jgi:hypothetical protein